MLVLEPNSSKTRQFYELTILIVPLWVTAKTSEAWFQTQFWIISACIKAMFGYGYLPTLPCLHFRKKGNFSMNLTM
jgi:hypothetical protein